uniref:Uncharacterized protein n=1 Tax=Lotharella oceanica TaxID=641309 RepID=A0A7S2U2W5_9EUKA|mmetsp:Transcript_7897/g.15500  ORF Transcript_7897/g.15500 Transcript_7897/m.15500 type:complete len:230 (+) Transcript_7897:477-1166(+)
MMRSLTDLHYPQASVFDSMQQHECMQRATWWLTHVLSCLFLLSINISSGEVEIRNIYGEDACVFRDTSELFLVALSAFFGLLDLIISLACLHLLMIPIFAEDLQCKKNTGAVRNTVFGATAVVTTLTFVTFVSYHASEENSYIMLRLNLGIHGDGVHDVGGARGTDQLRNLLANPVEKGLKFVPVLGIEALSAKGVPISNWIPGSLLGFASLVSAKHPDNVHQGSGRLG